MTTPSNQKLVISNRYYDLVKYVAQILLPSLGSLYFALSQIWNLYDATKVVGTLTVFDTFLGVLLGLSSKAYTNSDARFDGSIDIEEKNNSKLFSLNLDSNPDELDKKDEVTFKVQKSETSRPPRKAAVKKVAKKDVSDEL